MVIWNRRHCAFERFGGLKCVTTAVRDGKASKGDVIKRDSDGQQPSDALQVETCVEDLEERRGPAGRGRVGHRGALGGDSGVCEEPLRVAHPSCAAHLAATLDRLYMALASPSYTCCAPSDMAVAAPVVAAPRSCTWPLTCSTSRAWAA